MSNFSPSQTICWAGGGGIMLNLGDVQTFEKQPQACEMVVSLSLGGCHPCKVIDVMQNGSAQMSIEVSRYSYGNIQAGCHNPLQAKRRPGVCIVLTIDYKAD